MNIDNPGIITMPGLNQPGAVRGIMEREEGFYWVKHLEIDRWEAVYFNRGCWWPLGVPAWVTDKYFFKIYEHRIIEPNI